MERRGRSGGREEGEQALTGCYLLPPYTSSTHFFLSLPSIYIHIHKQQVKKTTKMLKVFKSYAERKGVSILALRFFCDGTVREWEEGRREGGRQGGLASPANHKRT